MSPTYLPSYFVRNVVTELPVKSYTLVAIRSYYDCDLFYALLINPFTTVQPTEIFQNKVEHKVIVAARQSYYLHEKFGGKVSTTSSTRNLLFFAIAFTYSSPFLPSILRIYISSFSKIQILTFFPFVICIFCF